MTQVTLKTIEQNDNVGMFSICFDGNSESEFEKFLMEFKDNATYVYHHYSVPTILQVVTRFCF